MATTNTVKRLNFYCQIMIVLLGLIAVRLWAMPVDVLPSAQAQFMDSGAQRLKLIKTAERTNTLLAEINDTLKGTLKVQIQGDSDKGKKSKSKTSKSRP